MPVEQAAIRQLHRLMEIHGQLDAVVSLFEQIVGELETKGDWRIVQSRVSQLGLRLGGVVNITQLLLVAEWRVPENTDGMVEEPIRDTPRKPRGAPRRARESDERRERLLEIKNRATARHGVVQAG